MLLNCGVREDSLRVPWTARRSNQSILKENSSEHSLEGLRLKLKLQYFGCLMWRTDSFEKTLMLGKVEGRRRDDRGWDGWMALLSQWTWVCTSSGSWWWTGKPGVLQSMGSQRVGHDWVNELKWGTFLKFIHAFASPLLSSPNLPSSRNTLKYWKNTQHWAITEQSREAAQF